MTETNLNITDIRHLRECLDNVFGTVNQDIIDRLVQVAAEPRRYWDRDNGIILRFHGEGFGLGLTLWQAWIATDKKAPQVGPLSHFDPKTKKSTRYEDWKRYPSTQNILRAIEYAMFLPVGPHRRSA